MLTYCIIILQLLFECLFVVSMSIFLYRNVVFQDNYIGIIISFILSFTVQLYAYFYENHYYYYAICILFITEHKYDNLLHYMIKCIERTCMVILYYNVTSLNYLEN